MNIKEFRKLIKGLPGGMDIAIATSEEHLMPICPNTNVIEVQFNASNDKTFVFVIKPCACEVEKAKLDQISLN